MQEEFENIKAKLIENSERYAGFKKTGKPDKLIGMSIAVTGRCNSRCIQCNIWKLCKNDINNPVMKSKEITKEEIIQYLQETCCRDLVEVDLTGGEPFLREDIVEIVTGIAELKKTKLKKLKTIIIPSNGFLTDTIVAKVEQILETLKGKGIDFVSVTSLDGIENTHDIMRGTKDAFKKATNTIEGLLKLREKYGDYFWMGIKTTITHFNVDELNALLDFALKRQMFYIISSVIITRKRFRNEASRYKLQLSLEDLHKILSFYNNRKMDFDFYYQKIFDSIVTGRKQWICTALYNYLFIDYDRKVYPCPIQDVCVGDLSETSLNDIVLSKKAEMIRQKVGTYCLCRHCTEPGAVRYSQVLEGKSLINFIDLKGHNVEAIVFQKGLHKLLQ